MVTGLNTPADLFSILPKFRSYEITVVFDITKTYNSIMTRLLKQLIQRLWSRESPEEECKQYAFN